ncbi:MAG: hypothetical protein ABI596_05630, partial [Pyrinomonadaceae bacterium]
RLRYSTEGRAKKVRIEGLFFPALVRLGYRVPVAGYLLNLAVALARLPNSIRRRQQFEAHVMIQQDQIVEYANHVREALESLSVNTSAALARLQQSTEQLVQTNEQQAGEQRERSETLARGHEQQQQELARAHKEQLDSIVHRQQEEIETLTRDYRQSLEIFANEQRLAVTATQAELDQLEKRAQAQDLESQAIRAQLQDETGLLESKQAEVRTRLEVTEK